MPIFTYNAFGLVVHSDLPLSAMPAVNAHAPADLTLRRGRVFGDQWPNNPGPQLYCVNETTAIHWPGVGAAMIRGGSEIVVEAEPGVSDEALIDWIQGSAFSLALHQRGLFVLHASAVVIDGRAVAFAGEVGQGKSTTASAFHAVGHAMLTDDLVVVDTSGPEPMVLPGFPHVKLMDETAAHFGIETRSLKSLEGEHDKHLRPLTHGFQTRPIPLAAVCFLEDGPALSLTAMPMQTALRNLMRHAFVARMTSFLDLTNTAGNHFRACTTIVQQARLMELKRPRDLKRLPSIVQSVQTAVATVTRAA